MRKQAALVRIAGSPVSRTRCFTYSQRRSPSAVAQQSGPMQMKDGGGTGDARFREAGGDVGIHATNLNRNPIIEEEKPPIPNEVISAKALFIQLGRRQMKLIDMIRRAEAGVSPDGIAPSALLRCLIRGRCPTRWILTLRLWRYLRHVDYTRAAHAGEARKYTSYLRTTWGDISS
jgi:hypothetical protein